MRKVYAIYHIMTHASANQIYIYIYKIINNIYIMPSHYVNELTALARTYLHMTGAYPHTHTGADMPK